MRRRLRDLWLAVLAVAFSQALYAQNTCATATPITTSGLISAPGPSSGSGCFNCGGSAANANWYSFTAPADGTIDISACGLSATDTRLWVYDGSCGTLNQIAADDDACGFADGYASAVTGLSVTNGTTYYLEWDDRWSTSSFDFNFTFTPSLVTGNNTCASAAVITSSYDTISDSGPSSGAGCNNCSSGAVNASWYAFTAPADGVLDISACNLSAVDTRLWIYEGSCGSLTQVASDDDACGFADGYASEVVGVPVTAGLTYYLEWDDRWSGNGFDFIFSYQQNGASCGNPNIITTNGLYSDPGPGSGGGCNNCTSGASNASWYEFTAPANGTIDISACGLLATDTRLWVYDGSCGSLNQIAADDDACGGADGFASEVLGVPVSVGVTYYLEWDDRWNAAPFDFNFTFNAASCALAGTYTIDAGQPASATNYQSFSAAAADLMGCGVSAPVTFNVAAGTYTDTVYLGSFTGASAANPVVFDGGDSATTTIVYNTAATDQNAVILLDGADHVTFRNLTLSHTTATDDAFGVRLQNRADTNALDAVRIELATVSAFGEVIGVLGNGSSTSAFSPGDAVNGLTITNSAIVDGYYGVRFEGSGGSPSSDSTITIQNTHFDGNYGYGAFFDDIHVVRLIDNVVDGPGISSKDGFYFTDVVDFIITGNEINVPDWGMYFSDANFDAAPTAQSLIANNIVFSSDDEPLYGTDFESCNVYFNTFVTTSSSTSAYGFYVNDPVNLDIQNNVFYSEGSYAFYSPDDVSTATNVTVDYNLYYTNSSDLIYNSFSNIHTDLAAWQAANSSLNVNSVQGDPVFVDITSNWRLLGLPANNAGTPIGGITTDIDGDPRSATTPDIGADEFMPATCFPSSNMIAPVTGPDSIVVNWVGGAGTANFNIEYGLTGFTLGTGTQITALTDTFATVNGLTPNTTYDFYVQDSCGVGDVTMWAGPFTFSTSCLSFALPYSEGFDGGFPSCWSTNDPTYAFTSSCALSGQGLIIYSPNGTYAETPVIDASTVSKVKLAYFYRGGGSGCGNSPESSDSTSIEYWDGTQWVNIKNYNGSNEPTTFTRDSVIISTGLTAGLKFRFVLASGTGTNFDSWSYDSVTVEEVLPCADPTALGATNIDTSSADLFWTSSAAATQWAVEIDTAGFALGTGTRTIVTNDTSNISGLATATAYDYYVAAICSPGDTSAFVGPFTFYTNAASLAPIVCTSGGTSVVFTEEFDNGANGWTGDINSGNGSWEIPGGPTSANTGPNNAHSGASGSFMSYEASSTTANSGSAVSPAIDLSAGNSGAQLSFWMYAYGASIGTMDVGVGTSPTGPFTTEFTWSGPLQTSGNDPWINVQLDLSAYVGQTIYLEFFNTDAVGVGSGFDGDIAIDLVEVSTCVSCPAPTNPGVIGVTATTADIYWTGGGASNWNVEYGPIGFTPGTGTVVNASNDTITLTGLSSATDYEYYVRDSCGLGDVSPWVGPTPFTTPCVAFVAPYTESFDNTTIPNCWATSATTGGPWVFGGPGFFWNSSGCSGTPTDHTGNSGSFAALDHSSTDVGVLLEMPDVDVSALTTPYLEFYFWMCSTGYSPSNKLYIETFDGTSWTVFDSITSAGASWNLFGFDVSAATQSNNLLKIRFRAESGGDVFDFYGDNAIDDVSIIEAPTCFPPSNLGAFNVTSTSAEVFWTTGGSSNWNVEYGAAGFPLGTGTQVAATNDTLALSGLMATTTYDFYVQDSCSVGDVSAWVGPFSFTTSCAPIIPPSTEDFSAGFPPTQCWDEADGGDPSTGPGTLGTGAWTSDGFGNNGFSGAIKINLYNLGDQDWALTPQYDLGTSGNWRVAFDFGVFTWSTTNPGTLGSDDEVILLISDDNRASWDTLAIYNSSYVTTASGNFETFSLASYSGVVEFAFWGTEGSVDDPEDNDIFVDNFSVSLPCADPTALGATNIDTSSADLFWTSSAAATQWAVEIDTAGFALGTGTRTIVTNDTSNISGLATATAYDYYVAAICSPGDTSAFVGPFTFYTNAASLAPIVCTSGGTSVVFTEEFDNGANGWTGDINSGNGSWEIPGGPTSANTGPNNAHSGASGSFMSYEASSTTANSGSAVSPAIDLSAGNSGAQLSFWMYAYGASIGTMDVGVGTSPTGPFTTEFTWSGPLQTSGNDPWINVQLDLSAYVGQTIYLEFFNTDAVGVGSGFDGDIAIDLVEVSTCVSCPAPTNPGVIGVTATTADIYWTGGGASNWNVEYGPIGFTPGTGTVVNASNDTITLTGLSSATDYEYYVRDSCGLGDVSPWVGPTPFTTPCVAFVAPYTESFDNTTIPNCWATSATTGGPWVFGGPGFFWNSSGCSGTPTDHTGNSGSFAALDHSSTDVGVLLEMPDVDVSALTTPYLEFYFWMCSTGYSPSNKLYIETFDGTTWTVFDSIVSASASWTKYGFDMSGQAQSNNILNVRFRAESGGDIFDFYGDNAIDDVSIIELPSCNAPTSPVSFNITTTSADVTWTTNNTPVAGSFIIEYDTAGFAPGTGNTVIVTNDTATISGLTQNTAYDYYVAAICGPGDTSAFAGPHTFLTNCAIIALPYTETFEPSSTTLSCWTVGANWGLGAAGGFGTSNTSVAFPFYSVSANTPFLAISPEFSPAPMGYQLSVDHAYATYINEVDSIIVEYSTDGGLTYTNLVVLDGGLNGPLNTAGSTTASFTPTATQWSNFSTPIPMGTNRVRLTAISAFGNNAYFDNFTIEPLPACDAPDSVAVANLTTTTADVSWVSSSSAVSSYIEYGPVGFTPGTGTVVSPASSVQTLSGLMPATNYQVCVYDLCSANDTSAASCEFFTTLCAPISSYPYLEDFDATTGADVPPCYASIATAANGIFSWRSNAGPTASTSTGPSVDHTLGNATGRYVYTEASSPASQGDTAYLELPEFDLTSLAVPELVYWYHMYGADITRLNLEIFNTTTSTWDSVFSIVGEQQTANSDPWLQQRYDLSAYTSATNLRMRFVTFRGASFNGDVSLDDIGVRETPACIDPINLVATNATASSVSLSWQSDTNIVSSTIEYGSVGFTLGTGTQVTSAPAGGTVTGLAGATCYDFYVKDSCSTSTNWIGPVTVCTLASCNVSTSPASATDDTLGCFGGSADLSAVASTSNDLLWMLNGEVREVGDEYATDSLTFTNVFDVAEYTSTAPRLTLGPSTNIAAAGFGNFTNGQYITVLDTVIIDSTTVRANGDVEAFVQITDLAQSRVIQRGDTFTTPAGVTADYQVPVNIVLTPGTYQINVDFLGGSGQLFRATGGASYPYTLPGLISIDSVNFASQVRYYYTFEMRVRKACIGPSIQATALLPGSNAGTSDSLEVCANNAAVDLTTGLGVYDFGGTWLDDDATGALTDSIFDANAAGAGSYNFTYVVPGLNNCPGDSATITVTVTPEADAGADSSIALCETAGALRLSNLLTVNSFGGSWVDLDGSGAFNVNSSIFNPGNAAAGNTYRFAFISPGGVCPDDSAIIAVTVDAAVSAGTNVNDTVCDTATAVDLNNFLDPSATAGGTWVDVTTTGALTGSIFDPSAVASGVGYNFRYVVNSACGDDSVLVNLFVKDCDISLPELAANALKVYPNPTQNVVNIEQEGNHTELSIKLFSANGQLLISKTFTKEDDKRLDLSNFAAGVYTLRIVSPDGFSVKQVVKQ